MKLLVPLLLIISAGSAWAASSGLMVIPTANRLKEGTCTYRKGLWGLTPTAQPMPP
jgi:galactose mutarotase-like enzyme